MEIPNNKNLGGRPLKAIKYQKEKMLLFQELFCII